MLHSTAFSPYYSSKKINEVKDEGFKRENNASVHGNELLLYHTHKTHTFIVACIYRLDS